MGHRVGLFNYATEQAGGHVDFDHYLLSDTLTAPNQPLDKGDLDAAIAHAATLDESDYPAEEWAELVELLGDAEAVSAGTVGTQNQIDAPERALSLQLARLGVLKASEPELDIEAEATTRCVAGKVVLTVKVINADDVPVTVSVDTSFGAKSTITVAPGKAVSSAFTTRAGNVPAAIAEVAASGTVDGEEVTRTVEADYAAKSCG